MMLDFSLKADLFFFHHPDLFSLGLGNKSDNVAVG